MECRGCTNYPRYHADRFHTYKNFPNNMKPDVVESSKRSIQEYAQQNSEMGGARGSQDIQYGRYQTSSTTTGSMFEEIRDQLHQSCNEEVFSSVYQELFMCEMVDPSISRSARVACMAA